MKVDPDPWQGELLNDHSQYIGIVCARQVGKTWAVSLKTGHFAATTPKSLSLVFAPSEQQSINLLNNARPYLREAGLDIVDDNKTEIRLSNGSEIRALPGSTKTIRGWSGPGMLIVDEAAFCSDRLWYAVEPMVAVSGGQVILLSSADATFGFFYQIMTGKDKHWSRYRVTAYECPRYNKEWLDWKRDTWPDRMFKREFMAEFVDPVGVLIPEDLRKAAEMIMDDPLHTDTKSAELVMRDLVV